MNGHNGQVIERLMDYDLNAPCAILEWDEPEAALQSMLAPPAIRRLVQYLTA